MHIFLNNKQQQLQTGQTIFSVLTAVDMAVAKGIAVAVNNKVIPKDRWETHLLNDNDHVTLIRATQGG